MPVGGESVRSIATEELELNRIRLGRLRGLHGQEALLGRWAARRLNPLLESHLGNQFEKTSSKHDI